VAITATPASAAKPRTPTAAAASVCPAAKIPTHTPGVLTIATDSAGDAPYFIDNDPSNGQGFESAVAYAVANELGFAPSKVKWVVKPLSSAFAPGNTSFDFDINEIAITPARAKQVSFSTPYYSDPLAVIVAKSGELSKVKELSGLVNAVVGVEVNTAPLQAATDVIDPVQQAAPYYHPSKLVKDFKDENVTAIVTNLATAFHLVKTELPTAKVLGQFSYPHDASWGLLLPKRSALTSCVDRALGALKANGTLAKLSQKWITSEADVPVLK
jgi:polar amino acid transport system substrate-binding protein